MFFYCSVHLKRIMFNLKIAFSYNFLCSFCFYSLDNKKFSKFPCSHKVCRNCLPKIYINNFIYCPKCFQSFYLITKLTNYNYFYIFFDKQKNDNIERKYLCKKCNVKLLCYVCNRIDDNNDTNNTLLQDKMILDHCYVENQLKNVKDLVIKNLDQIKNQAEEILSQGRDLLRSKMQYETEKLKNHRLGYINRLNELKEHISRDLFIDKEKICKDYQNLLKEKLYISENPSFDFSIYINTLNGSKIQF